MSILADCAVTGIYVAPAVSALKTKAARIVEAELTRLTRRLDGLDPTAREEVARALYRVADKLLRSPTARVKELAGLPGASSYETALRVLFDLDDASVPAVAAAADFTERLNGPEHGRAP